MKATGYLKEHKVNEFFVKRIRGGYYKVVDSYDMSMASLEITEEAAKKTAEELNMIRNKRLKTV